MSSSLSEEPAQIEPAVVEPAQVEPARDEPAAETPQDNQDFDRVKLLEQELRIRTDERENYKNRLKQMEIEMAMLQKRSGDNVDGASSGNVSQKAKSDREENIKLRDVVATLKETLREKTSSLSRKNLQTEALETQVAALKEVTMLSKGMLDIRNTENMKLKEQIDIMQHKITAERVRHNTMLKKTEQAASINDQLKEEYHKQVALFGELKERYERKVEILKEEIARLEALQDLTPT